MEFWELITLRVECLQQKLWGCSSLGLDLCPIFSGLLGGTRANFPPKPLILVPVCMSRAVVLQHRAHQSLGPLSCLGRAATPCHSTSRPPPTPSKPLWSSHLSKTNTHLCHSEGALLGGRAAVETLWLPGCLLFMEQFKGPHGSGSGRSECVCAPFEKSTGKMSDIYPSAWLERRWGSPCFFSPWQHCPCYFC